MAVRGVANEFVRCTPNVLAQEVGYPAMTGSMCTLRNHELDTRAARSD